MAANKFPTKSIAVHAPSLEEIRNVFEEGLKVHPTLILSKHT